MIKDKYLDVLESHGWSVSSYMDDGRVELETYSPAGEDFSVCVETGNLPEAMRRCAADFDVDDHIEMWIRARANGTGGIPSIRELVQDAEDIGRMLQEVAAALTEVESDEKGNLCNR